MPTNLTVNSSQTITIPEDAASINIKLFGGGGGGEFVNPFSVLSTAGTSGGNTTFIGLNAGGGQGGGIGGKNLGGAGGTGSQSVNWSSLGASVNTISGGGGTLTLGGIGGTITGFLSKNGGNGTPQTVSYTSSVNHVFNNTTNQHIVTNSSSDISVSYNSPGAPNDQPCTTSSSLKHYGISFVVPYDNSSYSISFFGLCQQAAAGASGSLSVAGTASKTRFGFRVWFCRNGNNSYIRCFSFTTSGSRSALRGRGGGGGAFLEATINRSQLIESSTYRPGTAHQLIIGAGGTRGGTSAGNGQQGVAFLTILIEPRITASVDDTPLLPGQCTILRWNVTGDVSQVTISPGIGLVNINGNTQICPEETITYTITATGDVGIDIEEIAVTVYQPPTVSISGPVSINYGEQGTLSYEATEVDISLKLSPVYNYKNGSLSGSMFDVNLPLGENVSESIQTQIPYNDFGPFSVTYVIVATGNGGQESKQIIIPINVDETPTNFLVPESEDLLKDQAPIFTPDAIVTSYEIVIDDIDIPVEVKADKPILIDVNSQEDWKPIREL